MARKKASEAYSKGLVYYESFFPNRNDMLQTALDNVLSQQAEKEKAAELALDVYKDYAKTLDKDIDRLKKLQDMLAVRTVDKTFEANKYNAGQTNTSTRTEYTTANANARFNAKQVALAAYFGSKAVTAGGAKGGPIDAQTANQARQSYTSNPTDVRSGLSNYKGQVASTTELPKSTDEVQMGMAYTVSQYVVEESQKPEYNMFGEDRTEAAAAAVIAKLDKADQDLVLSGMKKFETAAKGAGGGATVGGPDVGTGKIKTRGVEAPDYSGITEDIGAQIKRLEEEKAAKKAATEAQVAAAAEPIDMITAQRKEYFEKFFPNETPNFAVNETAKALLSMKSEDIAKIVAAVQAKSRLDDLAGRVPDESGFGYGGASSEPILPSGKQGPRMPGDIVGIEGTEEDMTVGVRQAADYDAIARTVSPEMRSQIGKALTQDQLFAIESSDAAKASLKSKGLSIAGGRLVPTALLQKRLEVGGQVEVPEVPPIQSLDIPAGESFEAMRTRELDILMKQDEKAKSLVTRAQMERDAAMKSSTQARSPQDILTTSTALEEKTGLLNEAIGVGKVAGENLAKATKKGFEAFTEDEMLKTRVNPLGSDKKSDQRSLAKLAPMTDAQRDSERKVRAAERAKAMYDAGEIDKASSTAIGKAVKDLYSANKAKGDQDLKSTISYIATEFPRPADQEEAVSLLFALNYRDEKDKKLK
jgi:hypothetical protein